MVKSGKIKLLKIMKVLTKKKISTRDVLVVSLFSIPA